MSQPTRISDDLAKEIKSRADQKKRSFPSQLEYLASIGLIIEQALSGEELDKVLGGAQVKLSMDDPLSMDSIRKKVKTASKEPASSFSEAKEYFYSTPGRPGFITKVTKNGKKIVGKFKHGKFHPEGASQSDMSAEEEGLRR